MSILRSKTWSDIPSNISISELMLDNVSGTPDDKIIYEEAFTGNTTTYGAFRRDAKRAAWWLKHSGGLQTGQTVSILSPSCIAYVLAVHSVWWAGGVVSLINYPLRENEIAYAIDLIRPEFLVIDESIYAKIQKSLDLCKLSPKILTFGRSHHKWTPFPVNFPPSSQELEVFSLKNRDATKVLGAILLSSGTTGLPKAVMLSHHNLVAAIYQLRDDNPANWRGGQREIFFPPLSHVYALYVCMTGACWLGAYVCLMPRFDMERYCALMQDKKATLARLIPPIAKLLAESPIVKKYSYPSLEYFSCAAAPLNIETASKLRQAFPGVALCQTYGCTELSGPCVQSGARDRLLPLSAAGTLIANTEMKFLSMDVTTVDGKGPGEITVRGPNVMMGYKDNAEATAETMLEDGWYRTGDLGYIDENGFLVVFDRLKDIIKYNGFQVSPIELEEILVQHPLVDEAAVCGVYSDQHSTELARAYVVLRKSDAGQQHDFPQIAEILSKLVADRVSSYKQLKGGIVFTDALPKNPTGKVLRRVLRSQKKESEKEVLHAKL